MIKPKTNDSNSLYSLIDRLQKYSEWKYPERKWDNGCAFQWMGKEKELEERVLELENDRDFLVENEFDIEVVAGRKVARPKDFDKCREWTKERGMDEISNNLDKMEVNKKLYFTWFW